MLYSKFKKVTKPYNPIKHEHGILDREVAEAAIILPHPAAIIDSDTENDSIVVISESPDFKNDPIIIAINENGNIDINRLKSLYGKEEFYSWFDTALDEDRLLYANRKKIQSLLRFQGVQFSQVASKIKSFDSIIHKSNNLVNSTENNSNILKIHIFMNQ